MIVVNTPSQELAFTNYAYCSESDFRKFAIPGSNPAQVIIGDSVVLPLLSYSNIIDGQIALNDVQRRHAKVFAGDQISVITFIPPASFSLTLLNLKLDYVKSKIKRRKKLDAIVLAQHLHKKFNNQIVYGRELLSKYVGETEKNVRDLFADAEQEQRARGDQSELHVIIFDKIDAICKSRGSTRDGTGVQDSVVNQLFTKIDGVETLNNVLFIGITNKRYLLDEALLRPGRLEILVEFNLPDESGRLQVLQIHTNEMKKNNFLAADVNLQELAARTKNYSGAELEGVVKHAVLFALDRQLSMYAHTEILDEENFKVTMNDFLNSLQENIPAFGASTNDLQRCRLKGMIDCGERHKHIYEKTMLLVRQVKSKLCQLCTCLLEGPQGSGKTAIAATIGIDSDFPYVKIVSAASMEGLNESSKCAEIVKVFEDAYAFKLSIIIIDNIERLLDYAAIGPRFSKLVTQTLLRCLKSLPAEGKNMLVIGTTSEVEFLESINLWSAFDVTYHVPTLTKTDAMKVLEHLNVFRRDDIDAVAEALAGMSLKKIYSVIDMAAAFGKEGNLEAIMSGREKIDINYLFDIMSDNAFT